MRTRYNEKGESFLSQIINGCIIGRQNARAHIHGMEKNPWNRHKNLKKNRLWIKF